MSITSSSKVLVCLHGWGGSKESFTELREALKNDPITILTPDLPGFGAEPEPKKPWTVDHYAGWVSGFIKHNVQGPFMLLGHSHGGRIAIKLASMNMLPIDHLYLCAAAGIRHPRHFKRIIGLTLAKAGKSLLSIPLLKSFAPLGKKLLYKLVRVHDYEQASPVMRQTLINVSAEDLRTLLKTIDIPTDIFWGTDDGMTPYADGVLMQSKIPHSTLHTYPHIRHGVHKERAKEIAEIIRATLSA
jgi:pimeloyl-ACP methyl ester carboxylesterase